MAYYNGEANIVVVYDLIDMLYKPELEMGKIIIEVKAITYVKYNKWVVELNGIIDATCPDVKNDIVIWKVIAVIKALPSRDSK